jgi:hypothetical protein
MLVVPVAISSATCAAKTGKLAFVHNGMRRVCLHALKTSSIANHRRPPPSLPSWQIELRKRLRICWTITTATMKIGSVRTLGIVRSVGGRLLHIPWCASNAGCRSVAAACGTGFKLGVLRPRPLIRRFVGQPIVCVFLRAPWVTLLLTLEDQRLRAWLPSVTVWQSKSVRFGITRTVALPYGRVSISYICLLDQIGPTRSAK